MRILSLSIACIILCSCSSINKQFGIQDDNPIEETVEEIIKVETGLNIDLTPDTPEK
jgi:hypothetical protein